MRYVSIDVLRTVAIGFMVVVHFMENLAGSNWAPGGIGAPVFTFLVGVSYRLWLNAQGAKGKGDDEITKVSIRRGLFLFGMGFAFNVLVWLPADTFNWDVLTLIGASMLLLTLVRHQPLAIPVLLAVMAFVLGPAMRAITDYPAYWTNGYFECDLTLSDVFIGFFANGFFPLFPWVAFPLAGFVTGSLFFRPEEPAEAPTGRAALIGAGLMGVALAAVLGRPYAEATRLAPLLSGWTMFPPSVEYVTGTIGLTLLSFALGHRWIDRGAPTGEPTGFLRIAATFSKYSLSMYLFHHIIHLWPLWMYGAAAGGDPTQFWRAAMPEWAAVPLSALCLVAGYGLFRWMEWMGWRGVESWMRYVCD